jgi:hypothetical protein
LGDVEETVAEDLIQEAADHIEQGRSLWRRQPMTLWRQRRFDFGPWRQEVAAVDLVYEAMVADLVREAVEDLVQEGVVVDLIHLIQKATVMG